MTRGIPSLKYLKMLSTAILNYNEKWRALDEQKLELPDKDEETRAEDWKEIIELAEEIHELAAPKKGRKSRQSVSPGRCRHW